MEIKLYTPHQKQKEIHNLLNKADDLQDAGVPKHKLPYVICLSSGRQSGKTELAKNTLLIWGLRYPDSVIWFVSPTDGQAIKVYKEFIQPLMKTGLVKSTTGAKGSSAVILKNGTTIFFKSAASRDNLRGASVRFLICDEFSYFPDRRVFDEVLLPTMSVKGQRILLLSTPKGTNFFYYYYTKGVDGNSVVKKDNPFELSAEPQYTNSGNNQFGTPKNKKRSIADLEREKKDWETQKFRSFTFKSSDNPAFDVSMLPTYLELLGSDRFSQEFEAGWTDKASIYKNIKKQAVLSVTEKPVYGKSYVVGVDVGLRVDAFCATVMDSDCNVCWIERHQGITSPRIRAVIKKLQEQYNPSKFLIEQNGIGAVLIDELKNPASPDYMSHIESFITTHSSKERICFALAGAIESGKVKLLKASEPNGEILINELGAFSYQVGRSGHITLGGISSADDCVMSLAITYEAVMTSRYSGLVIM